MFKFIGLLVGIFIAGSGGGIGMALGLGYLNCGKELSCTAKEIIPFLAKEGKTTIKKQDLSNVCITAEQSAELFEYVSDISLGVGYTPKIMPDYIAQSRSLFEKNDCIRVKESLVVMCEIAEGGGSGAEYCETFKQKTGQLDMK